MAAACPSLILASVMKKLSSPVFQKIKLNCQLRIQLGDLRSKLELIGDVLDDAEGMAILFPEFVRQWVCDLQRVLFELDDILDEALTRSMPSSGSMLEKVRLRLDSIPFDITIAHNVKKINNRLASIIEECCKCNLIIKPTTNNKNEKPIARKGILRYDPDYVRDDEFCMVGRNGVKRNVIRMLLREDDGGGVVRIRGDPGMGKSTLCRAVYNDEEINNHFELRLWITLEGDFPSIEYWKKILTTLLEADGGRTSRSTAEEEENTKDQLKDKVSNLIGQRKTLLVLDDLFPHKISRRYAHSLKSDLKDLIATSNKGSKILRSLDSTDRSFDLIFDDLSHSLNELSENDCRSIFENIAFVPRHEWAEKSPLEWMTDLGKQIVSNCSSCPALLKGVGTLLYGNEDRSTWEYFAYNCNFMDNYIHYCNYCRLCRVLPKFQYNVGYLSLFLEQPEFKYESMIQQFAAQEFNLSTGMLQDFEYRFLLLAVNIEDKWDTKGKYTIHNGVLFSHSDILRLAGEESTVLKWTETYLRKEARHVSFSRPPTSSRDQYVQDRILPDCLVEDVIHKRSLLFLRELVPVRMSAQTLNMLVANLQYLRVLDLHDMALQMLPTSLGKLIHLRYLDLSRNEFRVLPPMIYRLKNLLTLKLNYCDKLVKLSRRIKKLSHLKHLEINMCFDLTGMPSSIAKLTSLETLNRFIVSPHNGGLGYLQHLNGLNGNLSIEIPRRWEKSMSDVEQAYLERKIGLTELEFKWQGVDNGVDENEDDDVLEKLKPCTSIEDLSILNFGGKTIPSWIASLQMVTTITISQCKRCQILPPFHQMPSLKSLTLTSMNIEYLQDDDILRDARNNIHHRFFPFLRELKIGRMPRLKGWWNLGSIELSTVVDDLPRFPCLEHTEIWSCPYLTLIPHVSFNCHRLLLQDVSMTVLQSVNGSVTSSVEIISFQDMISLPNQFLTKLPKCLRIKGCNSLQTLWVDGVEGIEAFANVGILSIVDCPALKHLSSILRHLVNLKSLKVSRCSEELDCLHKDEENGMPWKALQNLDHFSMEGFESLVSLPKGLQQFPKLYSLKIMDCKAFNWEPGSLPQSLTSHTIQGCNSIPANVRSLQKLKIVDCPALKHLSSVLRHLVNLDEFTVSRCSEELDCLYKDEENGMPWKALQQLCAFTIEGFESLVSLPKGLRQLRELLLIRIKYCKALKWEPGSLPKSKHLTVKSCPHFSARIEELKMDHENVQVLE